LYYIIVQTSDNKMIMLSIVFEVGMPRSLKYLNVLLLRYVVVLGYSSHFNLTSFRHRTMNIIIHCLPSRKTWLQGTWLVLRNICAGSFLMQFIGIRT